MFSKAKEKFIEREEKKSLTRYHLSGIFVVWRTWLKEWGARSDKTPEKARLVEVGAQSGLTRSKVDV